MDNINKYRISHGMAPLSEDEKMKMTMGAIKQVENFNRKLDEKNDRNRIDHYDRFGNYHIYD